MVDKLVTDAKKQMAMMPCWKPHCLGAPSCLLNHGQSTTVSYHLSTRPNNDENDEELQRALKESLTAKCQFCGYVLENMDSLHIHQITSCSAIEKDKDDDKDDQELFHDATEQFSNDNASQQVDCNGLHHTTKPAPVTSKKYKMRATAARRSRDEHKCTFCLKSFGTEEELQVHSLICGNETENIYIPLSSFPNDNEPAETEAIEEISSVASNEETPSDSHDLVSDNWHKTDQDQDMDTDVVTDIVTNITTSIVTAQEIKCENGGVSTANVEAAVEETTIIPSSAKIYPPQDWKKTSNQSMEHKSDNAHILSNDILAVQDSLDYMNNYSYNDFDIKQQAEFLVSETIRYCLRPTFVNIKTANRGIEIEQPSHPTNLNTDAPPEDKLSEEEINITLEESCRPSRKRKVPSRY